MSGNEKVDLSDRLPTVIEALTKVMEAVQSVRKCRKPTRSRTGRCCCCKRCASRPTIRTYVHERSAHSAVEQWVASALTDIRTEPEFSDA